MEDEILEAMRALMRRVEELEQQVEFAANHVSDTTLIDAVAEVPGHFLTFVLLVLEEIAPGTTKLAREYAEGIADETASRGLIFAADDTVTRTVYRRLAQDVIDRILSPIEPARTEQAAP